MIFVHIADMHFDTPFRILSDRANLGEIRRLDQRKAFKKIIEYIKQNEISYLFIAGDLYDHKYIRESTIKYINELFKEIPNTKIYISPLSYSTCLATETVLFSMVKSGTIWSITFIIPPVEASNLTNGTIMVIRK